MHEQARFNRLLGSAVLHVNMLQRTRTILDAPLAEQLLQGDQPTTCRRADVLANAVFDSAMEENNSRQVNLECKARGSCACHTHTYIHSTIYASRFESFIILDRKFSPSQVFLRTYVPISRFLLSESETE